MGLANGLTVVLDGEYKNEALDRIKAAIQMVKGVITVDAIEMDPSTFIAKETAKHELKMEILNVFMK